jgi:hypothetical protein
VHFTSWTSFIRTQLFGARGAPKLLTTLNIPLASCSCEQGIKGEAMGMLGKAWSTGALMMVQVADTLPKGFHPRPKLEGEHLRGRLEAPNADAKIFLCIECISPSLLALYYREKA